MTTAIAGGYHEKLADKAEELMRAAGIGLTATLPMPLEYVDSTSEIRRHIERHEGLRRLDSLLSRGHYHGRALEKNRIDVLLKLYQRASYQGVATWWRKTTGETVSCNTVKNFAVSMVRVGLLPAWIQDRRRYRAHRPRDIVTARMLIKKGVSRHYTIEQVCVHLHDHGVRKPCRVLAKAREKMVAAGELPPRAFLHKRLMPHRRSVVSCARGGMSFSGIASRHGVSIGTVTRFIAWLVSQGDLPKTSLASSKLSGYVAVIEASMNGGMSVPEIRRHLQDTYGVTVGEWTVAAVVHRLQLASGRR